MGFEDDDVRRAIAVLEAIVEDRGVLATLETEQRRALLVAAGKVSRPNRDELRTLRKALRRRSKNALEMHDRELRAQTEIRAARRQDVFVPPLPMPETTEDIRELKKPRNCYVCKALYTRVHFFYDALCSDCGDFNYKKRFQTARLDGRVALITGARVKIGYHAALMMLRAGAEVIVTTRFPRDAAARFAREADFASWASRLEVHGLDLRHAPSVEIFARYLTQTKSRLDILVNNAAQTVRRPPGFYAHLVEGETKPVAELDDRVRKLVASHERCKADLSQVLTLSEASDAAEVTGFLAWPSRSGPAAGIREAALLSQVPCAYDDPTQDARLFPVGRTDADLQQVDLRTMNSWRLGLADVPSPEMLEVQLVNAVAPFILCSKLKPLMTRHRTGEKHIVNVSAMEGQFSRGTKTDRHPHTNMAKAALNMMTLTSAPDYAKDGIFMNAVDTGWVTDEDPAQLSARKQIRHDFEPPLDIVDGAARICDPFFSGLIEGTHVWGKFLKDYAPTAW